MARIVTDAVSLYVQVHAGHWAAAVTLTADNFTDPKAAGDALDALAVDPFAITAPDLHAQGDQVTFDDAERPLVRSALDLYMRILLGQFDQVAWSTNNGSLSDACDQVRLHHQRAHVWPQYPRSSWSIAGDHAPRDAQIAYDAWKLLGGGIHDRPLLTRDVALATRS